MAASFRHFLQAGLDVPIPGLARLGLSSLVGKALESTARNRGPLAALESLVSGSHVGSDAAQTACVVQLQVLWDSAHRFGAAQLVRSAWQVELRNHVRNARNVASAGLRERREQMKGVMSRRPERPVLMSRGLYVWGGVGRGKSLLMDLFALSLGRKDETAPMALRQHYHEFSHALHLRLHALRQVGGAREAVAMAAAEVAQGPMTVLCLDEFQVTTIADAVILKSLFEALLSHNVMVVTTSNRPPEDLYRNGLNHMLYMPPFIRLIESKMGVHHIDASQDYRIIKAQADASLPQSIPDFLVGDEGVVRDRELFDAPARAALLSVAWGRTVKCSAVKDGIASFTFQEICGLPISAEDYMALVELNDVHTLVVTDIPCFSPEMHNEGRRFTNLVDCLYERQCRLLCTAAVKLEGLMDGLVSMRCLPTGPQVLSDCSAGMTDIRIAELDLADARMPEPDTYATMTEGQSVMGVMAAASASLEESGFSAQRCISRLREMGTAEYHAAHSTKWALASQ